MKKAWIVLPVLAVLFLLAVFAADKPLKLIFLEQFESEELLGWDREWLPGFSYRELQFESGSVFDGAISRSVKILADGELHLEFRASIESGRGEMAVALFNTWAEKWDGYLFHLDGEGYVFQPNVRIYRMDNLEKTLLGHHSFNEMYRSHTYEFIRDPEGAWRLKIDGYEVPNVPYAPDNTYTVFNRIGVISNGEAAKVGRIRIRLGE